MRELSVPFAFALLAALVGCKAKSEGAPEPSIQEQLGSPGSPAPSASAVQIAAGMAGCDDVGLCARECDAGGAEQCRLLAVTYEFGRSDAGKSETLGTAFFDRACALGNAAGCVSSGQMHEYAHGVPKDVVAAAGAYEKACTSGSQVGCANWAIMLENGRGVEKDVAKARTLYEGACKAGAGLACDRLKAIGRDGGA